MLLKGFLVILDIKLDPLQRLGLELCVQPE